MTKPTRAEKAFSIGFADWFLCFSVLFLWFYVAPFALMTPTWSDIRRLIPVGVMQTLWVVEG